jgi:tyrosyl-tRNA synthetase
MKTGYELITKVNPKTNKAFSITIPIITSDKGEKLGKSAGNAVWLDADRLSPFAFYQFFVNTSDQMVETYLKIFTFLSLDEIEQIMKKHNVKPELYAAQKKLAASLTMLVHGSKSLTVLNFWQF